MREMLPGVLTNRNHFRAGMRVKERTGAPIAIHPSDAAFVRDRGDFDALLLADGAPIPTGGREALLRLLEGLAR